MLRAGMLRMNASACNGLFLCTGNSARSRMAECLLRALGRGRFRAFSAGSFPKGEGRPQALQLLKEQDFSTEGLRSRFRE